jgi:hypothetical protein
LRGQKMWPSQLAAMRRVQMRTAWVQAIKLAQIA